MENRTWQALWLFTLPVPARFPSVEALIAACRAKQFHLPTSVPTALLNVTEVKQTSEAHTKVHHNFPPIKHLTRQTNCHCLLQKCIKSWLNWKFLLLLNKPCATGFQQTKPRGLNFTIFSSDFFLQHRQEGQTDRYHPAEECLPGGLQGAPRNGHHHPRLQRDANQQAHHVPKGR